MTTKKRITGGGVIFTRAPKALLVALDKRVELERKAHPGHDLSQSDVVRDLLWSALLATPQETK